MGIERHSSLLSCFLPPHVEAAASRKDAYKINRLYTSEAQCLIDSAGRIKSGTSFFQAAQFIIIDTLPKHQARVCVCSVEMD